MSACRTLAWRPRSGSPVRATPSPTCRARTRSTCWASRSASFTRTASSPSTASSSATTWTRWWRAPGSSTPSPACTSSRSCCTIAPACCACASSTPAARSVWAARRPAPSPSVRGTWPRPTRPTASSSACWRRPATPSSAGWSPCRRPSSWTRWAASTCCSMARRWSSWPRACGASSARAPSGSVVRAVSVSRPWALRPPPTPGAAGTAAAPAARAPNRSASRPCRFATSASTSFRTAVCWRARVSRREEAGGKRRRFLRARWWRRQPPTLAILAPWRLDPAAPCSTFRRRLRRRDDGTAAVAGTDTRATAGAC
uniref:UL29A n=1 Tax=Panine betaherpesvirus 2 TaxID=188763 RepID=A0A8F7KAE4_9BETA|nr:UL29A [Panine betaherpesvirus 2]